MLSMLGTGHLWATDAAYMNDPNELRYGFDLLAEVASAELPQKDLREVVLAMIEEAVQDKVANGRVYVASFCRGGDLLSQWRAYGAFGGGYALGFPPADLFGTSSNAREPVRILRPVLYDRDKQVGILKHWMRTSVPRRKWDHDSILFEILLLFDRLMTFKHPSYSEEGEWRLIQFGRVVGGPSLWPASFRVRGNQVVPYGDLDLTRSRGSRRGKLPIIEIVCGPTISRERGLKALRQLCESLGYRCRSVDESRQQHRGQPEVVLSWSRAPFVG